MFEEYRKHKIFIGGSDFGILTFEGISLENDEESTYIAHYPGNDIYHAFHITDKAVVIPSKFHLVAEFKDWMMIHDDDGCTACFAGDRNNRIKVYRSGGYQMIIKSGKYFPKGRNEEVDRIRRELL